MKIKKMATVPLLGGLPINLKAQNQRVQRRELLKRAAATTLYDGPKGNVVYSAGSTRWVQGLSSPPGHVLPAHKHAKPKGPDKRAQRMMKNVFDRFVE